jgi:hypothetical protein
VIIRALHGRAGALSQRAGVAIEMIIVLLALGSSIYGQSTLSELLERHSTQWMRVEVVIIARGSNVKSSSGNMDSYLAIISRGKSHEETVARLVHYYASFQPGIPDDRIASGAALHLRVTSADYCRIDAKDFLIRHVFDEDAVARIRKPDEHNTLPCLLVRD